MVRQARRAANLVPGASLRGLVFDSCYDNRIPHTFGMLRHFGMPNRNRVLVSESEHLNTGGLASALRIDEAEVLRRRYPLRSSGHREFFGICIMRSRIEDRVRRFSPAAIARGIIYHPATHELRDLPFSTMGWDILQDACPCENRGVVQNWVTVNGSSRCHSCGGSLGKVTSVPVPEHLRPSLQFVAGLVDPDPTVQRAALAMLPGELQSTSRTLLYDIVMNIVRALDTDVEPADPLSRTTMLAQACQIVIGWPNGLTGADRPAKCPEHRWDWIRRTYPILDRDAAASSASTGSPAPDTRSSAYAPSRSGGRLQTNFLSAMEAARLGGVDEQALKNAWDDGIFTKHVWTLGGRRVRVFDPGEVIAIAPTLRLGGSRAIAARHLGLPVYGLEQLLEVELFTPVAPSRELKQITAHREAAYRLVAKVEGKVSVVSGPTVPFLDAIRHVSGRPKPWGAAFVALLNGDVPFSLRRGAEKTGLAGRIIVGRDSIADLASMSHEPVARAPVHRSEEWVGADAIECLNGAPSSTYLLEGLPFSGTASKRCFRADAVLKRAAAGVTTFDLSRRAGVGTRRIVTRLEENNVKKVAPGLWERSAAEKLTLVPGSW